MKSKLYKLWCCFEFSSVIDVDDHCLVFVEIHGRGSVFCKLKKEAKQEQKKLLKFMADTWMEDEMGRADRTERRRFCPSRIFDLRQWHFCKLMLVVIFSSKQ